MGKKIYNFVLRKDWDLVAKKLRGPLPSMDNPNIKEPQVDPDDVICEPEALGRYWRLWFCYVCYRLYNDLY